MSRKIRAGNTGKAFKYQQNAHPGRSVFDLSYTKLFTGDMGLLYPVAADEVVPGDSFEIGVQAVIRMMPLVAPVLHEINVYSHWFFCPTRLLWDEWETFISGGVSGDETPAIPKWTDTEGPEGYYNDVGTLWDYLGLPTMAHGITIPTGTAPIDFMRRAYYLIWNEYYRDETQQAELDITDLDHIALKRRAWTKDYFTSALPWQQRGTPPALPITGNAAANWASDISLSPVNLPVSAPVGHPLDFLAPSTPGSGEIGNDLSTGLGYPVVTDGNVTIPATSLNNNTVNVAGLATVNIADLRLAVQLQRWFEKRARSGVRYKEYLESIFGVSPRDDRLQRPEYIGGSKSPLIISEVLQTSETDTTPQGTMAGHGITVTDGYCGKYFATEYGYIFGIMSIMPVPMYSQGVNRQYLRNTNVDFYNPAFAMLSEQAIIQEELFADGSDGDNEIIFGYQGRYDEMRYKPNQVCGLMRPNATDSLAFWHLARSFDTAPALNEDFIICVPDKRIFAVEDQPGFLIHWANKIKAIRPLPISSQPGLMDHSYGG